MYVRWLLIGALAAALIGNLGGAQRAAATHHSVAITPTAASCVETPQASGSLWKICYPLPITNWNTAVVVWAHGYEPPGFARTYQDALTDGTPIADIVTGLGFAFITSTYPANGLVVTEAKQDLQALLTFFKGSAPAPTSRVFLIGASMGGLIATQLAEGTTGVFDGALAVCPIAGDFRRQNKYWGDFNVLYRTFFSNVVASWDPPPGITTTSTLWDTLYQPSIVAGLTANITATQGLLATSKAAVDPQHSTTVVTTVVGLARFSFLSSEDAALRLGGNPFENRTTWYRGLATITDTMNLNKAVPRFAASPAALSAMTAYTTTGQPKIPLVVMHTTLDPIVPVDQTLLYIIKAKNAGSTSVTPYLVRRYGHCTFTAEEVQAAFAVLLSKVLGSPLPNPLPETLVGGAAVDAIVAAFAAAEAVPDPFVFSQRRFPVILQGDPNE